MLYIVMKYVEAESSVEALRKAKRIPVHEVVIHGEHWKNSEFSLKIKKAKRIGFKDGKEKRAEANNTNL